MRFHYRVLLDADEILADLQRPALAVISDVTGVRWTAHNIKVWDIFSVLTDDEQRRQVFDVVQRPGFCTSLQPLPGAVEAVSEMRELFDDVHVVTSPFYGARTWAQERMEWLCDMLGFSPDDVTFSRQKWRVYGDSLLDDKPETTRAWAEHHPGGSRSCTTRRTRRRSPPHRPPGWCRTARPSP